MLKVVLTLLLISSAFAEDCRPSLYKYREKALCFSLKLKSYVSEDCLDGQCGAIDLVNEALKTDRSKLSTGDSRHAGSKMCEHLGARALVVSAEKIPDELCLCMAKDQSAISCNKLGLR